MLQATFTVNNVYCANGVGIRARVVAPERQQAPQPRSDHSKKSFKTSDFEYGFYLEIMISAVTHDAVVVVENAWQLLRAGGFPTVQVLFPNFLAHSKEANVGRDQA